MAVTTSSFNSEGGFGVKETTILSDEYDLKNINSLSLQNTEYTDCVRTDFVLKGFDSAILSRTQSGNLFIPVERDTVNFATAHIIATNTSAVGTYSEKLEFAFSSNSSGVITTLSKLSTILKDNIPSQETWSIHVYDSGNADQVSLVSTVGGNATTVKWVAHVQLVSVSY
jgi:hypothetical protein